MLMKWLMTHVIRTLAHTPVCVPTYPNPIDFVTLVHLLSHRNCRRVWLNVSLFEKPFIFLHKVRTRLETHFARLLQYTLTELFPPHFSHLLPTPNRNITTPFNTIISPKRYSLRTLPRKRFVRIISTSLNFASTQHRQHQKVAPHFHFAPLTHPETMKLNHDPLCRRTCECEKRARIHTARHVPISAEDVVPYSSALVFVLVPWSYTFDGVPAKKSRGHRAMSVK